MKRILRKLLCFLLVVFLVLIIGSFSLLYWYVWRGSDVFAGYGAKLIASCVFVAGRTPEAVREQELALLVPLRYRVNWEEKTVTAWIFKKYAKTAVYREGLGVAVAQDADIGSLQAQARPTLIRPRPDTADLPWPVGDTPSSKEKRVGVDYAKLEALMDDMFQLPAGFLKSHTRAFLVVYDDEIVAERYAEGFDADQRFAAWSATKSVFHALYGIAVKEGKLSIQEGIPLWQEPGDERAANTIDMVLRMSSGLDYNEFDFIPPTPLTTMLFLSPGAGVFAAMLPLNYPPDTHWAYASASTNLLSHTLRHIYGDEAYYELPYRGLFEKIGMNSAILEADAAGTFMGSSFMYATARDYARFGLLYLHDGVWQGERILPEGWIDYGRTPTPTAPNGNYGAHWWLVPDLSASGAPRELTADPAEIFWASGFEGQFIIVVPARNLVIVKLSLDIKAGGPRALVKEVLAAFPEEEKAAP